MESSEIQESPYKMVMLSILQTHYAQYPWKNEELGGEIPLDIVLYEDGGLPILWQQVQVSAQMLGIPEKLLPAELVKDEQSLSGYRIKWKNTQLYVEEENEDENMRLALRTLLPALMMDSLHILHQQENVLLKGNNLGVFADENSITEVFTRNITPEMLLNPIPNDPKPTEDLENVTQPSIH